jgi:hypothetical protein
MLANERLVAKEAVEAYVMMSTMWPQLRGPLVISVLRAMGSVEAATQLPRMRLGFAQLQYCLGRADALHMRFNVTSVLPLQAERLVKDWWLTSRCVTQLLDSMQGISSSDIMIAVRKVEHVYRAESVLAARFRESVNLQLTGRNADDLLSSACQHWIEPRKCLRMLDDRILNSTEDGPERVLVEVLKSNFDQSIRQPLKSDGLD